MTNRREFCKTIGLVTGTATLASFFPAYTQEEINNSINKISNLKPSEVAKEEDFWLWVQQSYTSSPNIINLNNGGVSPQPKVVQDAFEKYNRFSNEAPTYYMWRILDQGREPLRQKLADLAGCSSEEIAINRNTTEALNNIIFGLNLKSGDEVVLTKQDYPNVINSWKQREARDGIKIKWVNLNLPIENDDEIVEQFLNAFTSKTRAVNVTHMINWTGQILPVKKIAQKSHERGIEVIVDSAHTFAHIVFKIPELDCDYLGTSLHKWLCAPFGTGLLYIRKDKIKNIWPMYPTAEPKSEDIKKFESMGTRSFPAEMAIGNAINFHYAIGPERKEARLRYLKNYWAEKAINIDKVKLHTSLKPEYSCALGIFSIENKKPEDIANILFDKYKIHVVSIVWENISGVRITPHVYTSIKDLDKLVNAVNDIAKTA